jgi:hypothetical protein
MKNIIKGFIKKQNSVFLLKVSNKRIKNGYAYIINQNDVDTKDILYFEKEFNFEIIGLNRCSKGYDNLHIILHTDIFNIVGTNGNVDDLKTLLKYDYIPCLVKLIK